MPARLFVALELGGEDRRALVAWAREAVAADRALRIVAAEQVHLTLAFLGHRPLEDVGPLSAVVEELAGWPLPALSTGAALWLAPRRPHVLTVAVADDDRRAGGAARHALGCVGGAWVRARRAALSAAPDGRARAARVDALDGGAAADAGARCSTCAGSR